MLAAWYGGLGPGILTTVPSTVAAMHFLLPPSGLGVNDSADQLSLATDTTCEIAFVDGGSGIPADIRQKIFTPFFTTKLRGSGLGLPTVKRFVEAHDGEVVIECPPAGGTTVLIRLPITPPARLQPAVR